MEKYIGKCLDSFLIPEFDQVEVLVVNDGSKDRSSEIAHEYSDRYPNSIRVIDKPNGNYGSCINAALPQATGRYVKILDADDTFDTNAFSELVKLLGETDTDVVITTHQIVDNDGTIITSSYFEDEPLGEILNVSKNLNYISEYIQMHRLVYKRDVFSRFSYLQTEGVSYTDSQWSVIPFSYCKTLMFVNRPVYRYLMGREGQTMDVKSLEKFINNFFIVLKDTCKYIDLYDRAIGNFDLLLKHILDIHKFVYFKVLEHPTETAMSNLKLYDNALRDNRRYIYDAIGNITWTDEVSFNVFEDIRKKSYPAGYKVPFFKRTELSLKVRIKSLFK